MSKRLNTTKNITYGIIVVCLKDTYQKGIFKYAKAGYVIHLFILFKILLQVY